MDAATALALVGVMIGDGGKEAVSGDRGLKRSKKNGLLLFRVGEHTSVVSDLGDVIDVSGNWVAESVISEVVK